MSMLARAASLSPFGPIFGKELRVTSRRKRTYLLRAGYLGLLLLALLMAYATTGRSYGGVAAQMQRQAELGTAFFIAFTIVSIGSMGLIGPVLTANAIGAEKLAKTLPVLLMTPITAWQVVSGKLLSRVLVALMLMGLSLPVLALCRLLGGVELQQMVAVICLATSIVIACAAIGLFLSLFLNRAAVVILLSYAILGVLYILLPVVLVALFDIGDGGPRRGMNGIKFLCAINPFMSAAFITEPRMAAFAGNVWIASVLVQLGFAGALVSVTAVLLRRQFRNGGEKAINTPGFPVIAPPMPAPHQPYGFPQSSDMAASPEGLAIRPPTLAPTAAIPAPAGKIRDIGDNPVLWRELRRPLLPKYWQRIVGVISVLIIMLLIYAVLAEDNDLDDVDVQGGFACVFFGVWWLLSAVLSATAISQEKETDTWTLLLATPMSGRDIVWGKVAGLLRRMLWPTVLIVIHFMLFVLGGVIPLWAMLFAVFMTVTCNSVWIATGVWISLKIKKVTFAVIANLMMAIVAYGVMPLMILIPAELLTRNGDDVAEHTGWYIPYFYLAQGFEGMRWESNYDRYNSYGQVNYGHYNNNRGYWLPGNERVGAATFVSIAVVCAGAHLLLAFLILQRTAASFDEIVGRAGRRRFVGIDDSADALLPVSGPALPGAGASVAAPATAGAGAVKAPTPLPSDSTDLYASPLRRLVAAGLDIALVQFACGVVGLIWGIIHILNNALDDINDDDMISAVLGDHLLLAMLAGVVVGILYGAKFESSRRRATPGKLLMGIFVSDTAGRRLTFGRALARQLSKLVAALPMGIGFLEMFVNRRRQGTHDRMVGSLVLRK